jgi:hypothetical protein
MRGLAFFFGTRSVSCVFLSVCEDLTLAAKHLEGKAGDVRALAVPFIFARGVSLCVFLSVNKDSALAPNT